MPLVQQNEVKLKDKQSSWKVSVNSREVQLVLTCFIQSQGEREVRDRQENGCVFYEKTLITRLHVGRKD